MKQLIDNQKVLNKKSLKQLSKTFQLNINVESKKDKFY